MFFVAREPFGGNDNISVYASFPRSEEFSNLCKFYTAVVARDDKISVPNGSKEVLETFLMIDCPNSFRKASDANELSGNLVTLPKLASLKLTEIVSVEPAMK